MQGLSNALAVILFTSSNSIFQLIRSNNEKKNELKAEKLHKIGNGKENKKEKQHIVT